MQGRIMDNQTIAEKLLEFARSLDAQESNVYRLRAYRRAAEIVLRLDRPVTEIVAEGGRAALEALPGVGGHLSYTIEGLVRTGEFRTLNGADGHVDCQRLFASLPGVGRRLARQLHEELGLETLEQLEQAAHEGRLAALRVGPKRLRGLIDALAGRLARIRLPEPVRGEPTAELLLAVDDEYRREAANDHLPTLAPRRFNPDQEPWLPIYTADRAGWRFRAVFSNTALAHRLHQTHDWVAISFSDGNVSGQRTIVTETRGALRGRRVVRGREEDCRKHYRAAPSRLGA
jgi:hypothetical protein